MREYNMGDAKAIVCPLLYLSMSRKSVDIDAYDISIEYSSKHKLYSLWSQNK